MLQGQQAREQARAWNVPEETIGHVVATWGGRGLCRWVGYDDRPNECLQCGDMDFSSEYVDDEPDIT